jgi:hypothetical protein
MPSGLSDTAAQSLVFDGTNWQETGEQPVFVLRMNNGTMQGNPFAKPLALPIFSKNLQSQVLHFSCEYAPDGVKVRLRKKGAPSQALHYQILENLYHEHRLLEVAEGEIDVKPVGKGWSWVAFPLHASNDLKMHTECYYVAFSTDSGEARGEDSCSDCFEVAGMEAAEGLQDASQATFDGGAHRSRASSSNDGKIWKDRFEADLNVVVTGPSCPPPEDLFVPMKPLIPAPTPISDVWMENQP